jgi:hypothetical protein
MPIISNFPTGGGSGGGGIPLAAVSDIKTLTASGKVYIKYTDPEDTIAGDVTLATWAGTLLVRKAGSMPNSRRDGTVILDNKERNKYSNTYFCDSGLSDGTVYYYKFFPYSSTNTYTDDTADEFTATPNPVKTGDVSSIKVAAQLNGRVQLNWTDPAATVISDGITLATWASTKVVYKTGSYPTSPEDGTLVVNSTTRNAYSSSPLTVTGLTNGTTYYFAFFPISTEGTVNTNTSSRITAVPNRVKITTEPSQSGTLTYNGSAQSPSWSNYSTTQLTIGGTTSGTNAGDYSATFTPKDDYCWSDGSTTAKTITWKIAKKTLTKPTLSKSEITLNTSTTSTTFTVTRDGDGVIEAESSDTSVATVSVSGTTVTVKSVNSNNGSATITITVKEGTNYTAYTGTDATCSVTASFISATLNDNTWAEIKGVSDAGTGANYWSVGDAKQITINGTVGTTTFSNFTTYAFIIGFNHNSAKEGNNRIHFQIGKTAVGGTDICLCDSAYNTNAGYSGTKAFAINHWGTNSSPYNTNYGGWSACDMRYDILGSTDTQPSVYGKTKTTAAVGYDASDTTATNPVANTLMAALPSDLRSVMKSCTKYSDNKGGGSDTSSYVTATKDYLWLLSEFEVQGTRTYANSAEQNYQAQYAYYSAGNSKIKYKHDGTTTAADWWLRSVASSFTNYFCRVSTDGSADSGSSRNSRGVAPAFCV